MPTYPASSPYVLSVVATDFQGDIDDRSQYYQTSDGTDSRLCGVCPNGQTQAYCQTGAAMPEQAVDVYTDEGGYYSSGYASGGQCRATPLRRPAPLNMSAVPDGPYHAMSVRGRVQAASPTTSRSLGGNRTSCLSTSTTAPTSVVCCLLPPCTPARIAPIPMVIAASTTPSCLSATDRSVY
jgi:hypothetical protein